MTASNHELSVGWLKFSVHHPKKSAIDYLSFQKTDIIDFKDLDSHDGENADCVLLGCDDV